MERTIRDIRYVLRGLYRAPIFTLVALITLALGIGVNSTIFSLVNTVLLKPLPVERPEELIDIYGHSATSSAHESNSYPNYLDYRAQTETLSGLMAYTNFFASLTIGDSPELVIGEIVSDNYFSVLGVEAALGRTFSSGDFTAPGANPRVILSDPFWKSRFGADPDVVGQTLRLNGLVYTVVGVMPERFGGMFPAVHCQMWIPITMVEEVEPLGNNRRSGGSVGDTLLERRGHHWLWLKGRMKPGFEVGQVRSELESIAARLSAEYPDTNERERVAVRATSTVGVHPDFDSTLIPAGTFLLCIVGLVLLVACANLANMMLARASTRQREIAIRLSIGAERSHLIRQFLTESFLLATAGGALGLCLAYWLAELLARFRPPLPIDLNLNIQPDWRVLVFTLAIALAAGVAFGLLPALRASRPNLVTALKDTGDREPRGPGHRVDLRDALVVVQVAFSVVLLVTGALLVRSLVAANEVDMGYDLDRTAYLALPMAMNGYDAEQAGILYEEGKRRLQAVPEVDVVGLTSRLPLSLNNNGFGVFIDGHQSSANDRPYIMDGARVDENYFEALGLTIEEGRPIEWADREERRKVAVVTQAMARRYWPDESALDQEFRVSWGGQPYRIVGIVGDYKVDTPGELPKPYLHLPQPVQNLYSSFLVKTRVPARDLLPRLERELRRLDADLVFLEIGTERELAEVQLFPIRAAAWLVGAFGGLALVLAAVGLYGVISYSVSRRIREIGIRKALGARNGEVIAMVFRQGMLLVAAGGVGGAILAGLLAQLLSSVLFVQGFDLVSFTIALAILLGVAALANWVPARRAASVDPQVALRSG